MYYSNNPNIVETDDILGIQGWDFQQGDGENYPLLQVTFVLDPNKKYTPQQLHVTNGVDHRLLLPGYEVPALETEAPVPEETGSETLPETATATSETVGIETESEGAV